MGDNVRVGAGSVVVQNVPSNTTVVGNPGRPVIREGAKVGIPDIDYTHLPDPVAEAMKCLVRRVVQLENELEELRGGDRVRRIGALDAVGVSGPSHRRRGRCPRPRSRAIPLRLDGTPDV